MKKAQVSIYILLGLVVAAVFITLLILASTPYFRFGKTENQELNYRNIISSIDSCKEQASMCFTKIYSDNDAGLQFDYDMLFGYADDFNLLDAELLNCISEVVPSYQNRYTGEIDVLISPTQDMVVFDFNDNSSLGMEILKGDSSKREIGDSYIEINWKLSKFNRISDETKDVKHDMDLTNLYEYDIPINIYEVHKKPVYELIEKHPVRDRRFYFVK